MRENLYPRVEDSRERERDFRVSLFAPAVRARVLFLRARSDKCKPSTTYVVDHVVRLVPALPARARPSCNPCQLVPPPRPVRPPSPREKSTRDRYLRGKMARPSLSTMRFLVALAVRILIYIFGVQNFFEMMFYREFRLNAFTLNCDYLCVEEFYKCISRKLKSSRG